MTAPQNGQPKLSDEDSARGPAYVVILVPIFVALAMFAGFLAYVVFGR